MLGCLCPLSLSFCLVCSPTTFFFLSFSVSGAGETQTPFGVWVSPCVLFLLDTDFVYNPHSELRTFPKVSPPHLLFFFFPSRRRRSLVSWLVWWRSVAFLFGFWWWVVVLGLSGPFCIACKMRSEFVGWGRRTRHPSPLQGLLPWLCFRGNGWGPISRVST